MTSMLWQAGCLSIFLFILSCERLPQNPIVIACAVVFTEVTEIMNEGTLCALAGKIGAKLRQCTSSRFFKLADVWMLVWCHVYTAWWTVESMYDVMSCGLLSRCHVLWTVESLLVWCHVLWTVELMSCLVYCSVNVWCYVLWTVESLWECKLAVCLAHGCTNSHFITAELQNSRTREHVFLGSVCASLSAGPVRSKSWVQDLHVAGADWFLRPLTWQLSRS